MNFEISDEIAKAYENLRIAIFTARNVTFRKNLISELQDHKRLAISELQKRFSDPEALYQHPAITCWRDAYRSFGVNPKRRRPSAESLLTNVLKNGRLPAINPVVDTYLMSEAKHLLPVGGYDLDKISGTIALRRARAGEIFISLRTQNPESTEEDEIIYADLQGVLTRRWNYEDSDRSKLTDNTTNLVLMIEAPYAMISDAYLERALDVLSELYRRFFDGVFSNAIVKWSKTERVWQI
jgi:DNA/RNA-binding domain of Phe-tRNA-synthetase-like protein